MPGFLSRRLSRRRLLASAGALAAIGAASSASALSLPNGQQSPEGPPADVQTAVSPLPIEVLQHDEIQEGAAFARGRLLYTAFLADGFLKGPGVFESEVIASPFPFTHSVLRWHSALATFEFRTSADGITWPDWRWSHLDGASIETSESEGVSTLVGAPRHRFLQYRARLAEEGSIRRVTAIFLNAKDGPVIESPVAQENSRPEAIDYSRADWGCDERLRYVGDREMQPRKFVAVEKLVVHHTVTPENFDDALAEVRALYTYHTRILGWGDIGYHVLIDQFGRAYEGRHGRGGLAGREVFSPDVVGAHASNHNHGTCGVALLGQFHGEGAQTVSTPMLEKLVDVLEERARESHIDPLAVSDFLLGNGEWNRGMPNIAGHRDCNFTSCPGDNAYALMDEVRSRLAARLAMQPAPQVELVQTGVGSVSFSWSGPEEAEYSYSLQGWSTRGREIEYLSGFSPDLAPIWSEWTTSTSVSASGLTPGHWSLHVRRRDLSGPSYKTSRSVWIDPQLQMHV